MSGTRRDQEQEPDDTGETRSEPAAGTQSGVLGNLPKTRPSVRSPRRAKRQPAAKPDSPAPDRADRIPEPKLEPRPATEVPPSSSTAELEALARTGMAVAGEVASQGLRFAGRAAAAVRDAVERR